MKELTFKMVEINNNNNRNKLDSPIYNNYKDKNKNFKNINNIKNNKNNKNETLLKKILKL